MTDTGPRIIGALEAAWRDVQARHPEVPDVVMITRTARQAGGDRWGHHWPERWTLADGSGNAPELFAAGELLAQGGRRVLVLAASKCRRQNSLPLTCCGWADL
jgi:hypothetical protein